MGDHILNSTQSALVSGFNSLGLALLRRLDEGENCFLSPLSVGLGLGMLTAGAGSETRSELENLLGVPGAGESLGPEAGELMRLLLERRVKDRDLDLTTFESKAVEKSVFKLHLANAIFLQTKFKALEAYQKILADCFSTDCHRLDFGEREKSADRINDWVAEQTNDFIRNLVSPEVLGEGTAMILVNAVYFLADWRESFPEDGTRPMPFHSSSARAGDSVEVAMMRNTDTFGYFSDDHMEAVELPFKAMSMVVVMPKRGSLKELERSIDAPAIERMLSSLSGTLVDLDMPKFGVESSFSLKEALEALGLKKMFNGMESDFSGITSDSRGVYVTEVVHRARIRVDEDGVEAAAATAIVAAFGCAPGESMPMPIRVEVNCPFLFFVVDRTSGTVLFAGRLTKPDKY